MARRTKRRLPKAIATKPLNLNKLQPWKTTDPPFFKEGERISHQEAQRIAVLPPSETGAERLKKARDQALLKQGAARQLRHEAVAAGDAAMVAYAEARDASAGPTTADILRLLSTYELRVAQQARAKRPRTDALSHLIETILQEKRTENTDDVLAQLRLQQGSGVIETVTEDDIEWTDSDDSAETTPISALKDRVHRAKKRIASRGTKRR